jgi:serine phosphatase RsbU (regulator of sigma subunit)
VRLAGVLFILYVLGFALFIYPGVWLPLFPLTGAGLLAFLLVNQFVYVVDEEELQQQRAEQVQHERELALSREIQTSLLPEAVTRLRDFVLVSRSEPAREVGGDFCSIFPLPGEEEVVGVSIGDVAGKGIRGAMYMTVATTLLEARAAPWATPQRVLADVNRRLYPRIRGLRMFVTAIYGTLDAPTGEFVYASAGQVPPLHLTQDGRVSYLPATGTPLGCLAEPHYRDERVTLEPGESLLLASDGFVEARSTKGQALGYEGFLELVRRQIPGSPEALMDALFTEIHAYLGEGDSDDLTLLLIHRQAGE